MATLFLAPAEGWIPPDQREEMALHWLVNRNIEFYWLVNKNTDIYLTRKFGWTTATLFHAPVEGWKGPSGPAGYLWLHLK